MSTLVLASGSATRAALLRGAGVPFTVDKAGVDEASVKASIRAEGGDADACAITLAELKAVAVSRRHPGALVLGADQMLDLDGMWFDKPGSLDNARAQLMTLRGRTHRLVSALVLIKDGTRVWHVVDAAELEMRTFSDDALTQVMTLLGDAVLSSVGGYQVEAASIQLFRRIQGDWSTIMGLPLLPLLDMLRNHGVVPA